MSVFTTIFGTVELRVIAVLAALLVAALGLVRCEYTRVENAKADIAAMTSQLASCKSANDDNLTTIGELKLANGIWAAKFGMNDAALQSAAKEAQEAREKLQTTTAALAALEGKERATAACENFLSVDLGARCPIIAGGLRMRATTDNR